MWPGGELSRERFQVIVFPAALGLEAAIQAVQSSEETLSAISLEDAQPFAACVAFKTALQVSQILQEEVQKMPSIANIEVGAADILKVQPGDGDWEKRGTSSDQSRCSSPEGLSLFIFHLFL